MLIEDLRRCNVRLISVTENLDSFNPNDDLIIGIKHVINDGYAKDTSRKIQTAFYQKQQKGLLLIPPFGYRKIKEGKFTRIEIIEECAEIVRKIFALYINGLGVNKICEYLIDRGIPSPAYYQKKYLGKNIPSNATVIGEKYIWSSRSISFILKNEAYIGVLVNHKAIKNTIYRTRTNLLADQHIRHEGFYPPIIDDDTFGQALSIRNHRNNNNVRASSNRPIYRYAGLLLCSDCEATFTAKKRDGYIQYVCNTYHRVSKKYCSSHRVNETELDEMVFAELARITQQAHRNWTTLDEQINTWKRTQVSNTNRIAEHGRALEEVENETRSIARQMLRDMRRESMYQEMMSENEQRAIVMKNEIALLQDSVDNSESAFRSMQSALEIMRTIIESRELDNSHLVMLIDKIYIKDAGDGLIDVELRLKATFAVHDGGISDANHFFTEGKASWHYFGTMHLLFFRD